MKNINLHELRDALGLSQRQLAKLTGVPKSNISRWEFDESGPVSYANKLIELYNEYKASLIPTSIDEIDLHEGVCGNITLNTAVGRVVVQMGTDFDLSIPSSDDCYIDPIRQDIFRALFQCQNLDFGLDIYKCVLEKCLEDEGEVQFEQNFAVYSRDGAYKEQESLSKDDDLKDFDFSSCPFWVVQDNEPRFVESIDELCDILRGYY